MALVLASVLLFSPAGLARETVVTSTADSGAGTLRWALETARSGDTITFDPAVFPPNDPSTIYPQSELPPIERPRGHITIDGSNSGVIIDGRDVPGDWNNGLQIYADNNTVMGLQIVNFAGSGIAICSASSNVIGGDREVGAGPIGQGNLISENTIGIDLCDYGVENVVTGNVIGTDSSGGRPWGNTRSGIWIEDGVSRTTIGPDNVIAYNCGAIEISGSRAVSNTITANRIYGNSCTPISLLDGGNDELEAPLLTEVDTLGGRVTGWACADCIIEVFAQTKDGQSVFEGVTQAAEDGWFVFQKSSPLIGDTVTATATNAQGSTGQLSGSAQLLQSDNTRKPTQLESRSSNDLEDNRIGVHFFNLWNPERYAEVFPNQILETTVILNQGLKHAIFAVNDCDWDRVDWSKLELYVSPEHRAFISELAASGVTLRYRLNFWNKAKHTGWQDLPIPRFKTEDEILYYLDFVRFIARELGEYVEYFELWGEPSLIDCPNMIEIDDYITLAHRAIPVIRQERPDAKIVVGAIDYMLFDDSRNYLFAILRSDLMPLVDGVSWHGMYGTSPEYEFHKDYYYDYPSIVADIVRIARENGFTGEFFSDELTWRTAESWGECEWDVLTRPDWPMAYSSETKAAKYLARGLVLNLGLDVAALQHGHYVYQVPLIRVISNLCTVMAGHEAIHIPVETDIDYDPTAHYGFQFPNGDRILAVWTDGIAQDEDPGVPATITFPGLTAETVTGIDVLHGFEQELVFETNGGKTLVRSLLVRDYPILIKLSDVTMGPGYEESVGDGFHRLGDVDAAAGSGSPGDRDGDGVPDEEDYCPDYPGDPATNGC